MTASRVLVLGSAGMIGTALVESLEAKGFVVEGIDIKNSPTQNLAIPMNSDNLLWAMNRNDFVYFLAFDVGGSKYLGVKQDQFDFIYNNSQIMSNVFGALKWSKKPFIFASSMMAQMPWSTYGKLKSLGESYTHATGNGVNARLWNVYGKEPVGEKSHVIPDLIQQGLDEGRIHTTTNGKEVRNFIHVNDCVAALETLRQHWPHRVDYDIASKNWHTIECVARMISEECNNASVTLGDQHDAVQMDNRIEPNFKPIESLKWSPKISLRQGIAGLVKAYEQEK